MNRAISDFSDQLSDAIANKDTDLSVRVGDAKVIEKALLKKTKKPRLFVWVSGGLIQDIISDTPVDIMVLDGDVDWIDEDQLKTYKDQINGSPYKAREAWDKVEVDKKVVDHYFAQR